MHLSSVKRCHEWTVRTLCVEGREINIVGPLKSPAVFYSTFVPSPADAINYICHFGEEKVPKKPGQRPFFYKAHNIIKDVATESYEYAML